MPFATAAYSQDNLNDMLNFRARLFQFAFVTERLRFLGLSYRSWLRITIAVIAAVFLYLGVWRGALIAILVLLGLRILFGIARRNGYITFKPTNSSPSGIDQNDNHAPLKHDEKIAIRGTGQFVSGNVETQLFMATGEFWQVPAGECVVMLEAAPGRFKYQMIQPSQIEKVRLGQLMLADRNEPAVEVRFKSQWLKTDFEFGGGDDEQQQASAPMQSDRFKKRTIYMSFDEMPNATRVWTHLTTMQ